MYVEFYIWVVMLLLFLVFVFVGAEEVEGWKHIPTLERNQVRVG